MDIFGHQFDISFKSFLPWANSPSEGLDIPGLGLDLVEVEDLEVVLLGPGIRWKHMAFMMKKLKSD